MENPKFRVYPDNRSEVRWSLLAGNGNKIADSGEGYKNEADCLKAIELMRRIVPTATVENLQAAKRRQMLATALMFGNTTKRPKTLVG